MNNKKRARSSKSEEIVQRRRREEYLSDLSISDDPDRQYTFAVEWLKHDFEQSNVVLADQEVEILRLLHGKDYWKAGLKLNSTSFEISTTEPKLRSFVRNHGVCIRYHLKGYAIGTTFCVCDVCNHLSYADQLRIMVLRIAETDMTGDTTSDQSVAKNQNGEDLSYQLFNIFNEAKIAKSFLELARESGKITEREYNSINQELNKVIQ